MRLPTSLLLSALLPWPAALAAPAVQDAASGSGRVLTLEEASGRARGVSFGETIPSCPRPDTG